MRSPAFLLSLAIFLAGCAAPGPSPEAMPSPTSTEDATLPTRDPHLVHMVQEGDANFFDPVTLTVKAGSKVTWDIVGEGHHTVDFLVPVDAAGTTPKSGDVGPGQTFEASFPEPGEYRYYCKYHSNKQTGMIGTILVE